MNGRSNSSAAGLVAVRVPEDEKSWYGISGVTSIIIVIVMSLRSRLTVFTRLGVLNYDPSTWRAGVTLVSRVTTIWLVGFVRRYDHVE